MKNKFEIQFGMQKENGICNMSTSDYNINGMLQLMAQQNNEIQQIRQINADLICALEAIKAECDRPFSSVYIKKLCTNAITKATKE